MAESQSPHSETVSAWTLREIRIRASLLLKAARTGDATAIARLGGFLKRRAALDVVARDMTGHKYTDLLGAAPAGGGRKADPTRFFDRHLSGFWNHWFASYDEASAQLRDVSGYLFPYRHQFVIVDRYLLLEIGIDPDRREWADIGFDWVRPKDAAAFAALNEHVCAAGFAVKEASDD